MNPNFIIDFWPYWIAGLIICPLIAIIPQLKNIRTAIDKGESEPAETGKLFLTPSSLILTIVFGLGTFVVTRDGVEQINIDYENRVCVLPAAALFLRHMTLLVL
jgi:hypothetical protein